MFAYVFVANVVERPDGIVISSIFIAGMLLFSVISRAVRSGELRVETLAFHDEQSVGLWREMRGKKVNLAPLKHRDRDETKAAEIRSYYKVEGPLAFLHVDFIDDRSEFESALKTSVRKLPTGDYSIVISNAVAVANTVAFISEELDPVSLFLTLTGEQPMRQSLRYLVWGEGEVGRHVYEVLLKHWRATPEDDVRPHIFLLNQ